MSIFRKLESISNSKGFCLFALIDPDKKNDLKLNSIIKLINKSSFDAILIGGSATRLKKILKNKPKAFLKIGNKPIIVHQIEK